MNPSADEETLSAAEVSKTNQVTVATVTTTIATVTTAIATVTTTSTTNTQTVAGTGACYIPLLTGYAPQQALPNYSYQSSGYQQSVADYQEHPINFLRSTYLAPPTRVQEAYNVYCMNDHANHVARRAYEKGWISRARVKKIFHRGLDDAFEEFRDGCLPPLYLNNMINYGKFYKYLSRS